MPQRRRAPGNRFRFESLLALAASCLCGCPQLLSDEFDLSGNQPDLNNQLPSGDGGAGTGGSAGGLGNAGTAGLGGSAGSAGSAGHAGASATTPPGSAAGAGGTGESGGAAGTPATDSTPPSVVSVSPSNGATGVAANASISVTFSKPMDPGLTQAAYSSNNLPSVTFSWSPDDTVLQIIPNQPLTVAAGTSTSLPQAVSYAFEIGAGAVDEQGNGLPPLSASFTTLRAITQTLDAVLDISLTGNWRGDDEYGDNSCISNPTTCVGDSSNANSAYRGFVTFDLSSLPSPLQGFSSATLNLKLSSIRNSPFANLGTLEVESVAFDSISMVAFNATALGSPVSISSSTTVNTPLTANVLTSAQADAAAARTRSQFRYRFSTDTNNDGTGDLVELSWADEKLAVTALIP